MPTRIASIDGRAMDELQLPSTKFRPPARRRDCLFRWRLVDALRDGVPAARLTLISGPAGAGKTSLLTELPDAFPEMQWAWLLLDAEDNDPSRFAAALACSLERLDIRLRPVPPESAIPQRAAGLEIVTATVNQIAERGHEIFGLAMDDFHVICEPSVQQTVEYLLERLPPNLRLVVASRSDPPIGVSRWRARGDVAELRFADLAFTQDETAELVNSCLNLSASEAELRELHARSGGWAAGLRLLASSMRQSPSPGGGTLRRFTAGRESVFEFLAEEVLDGQPAELRRFLLDTSVLAILSKHVCDSLTGRTDSEQILADLCRGNLYVAAADEGGQQYRYHDLFADFLRDRLRRERPEDWATLNARAAGIETDPGRRIQHWIHSGNWAEAAAEIERFGPEHMLRGFAFTVRRWILPLPERLRRLYPRLSYLLGCSIWARNEFNVARTYFEEALEGFRRNGDEEAQGECLVALSVTAINANDPERARALFDEALRFPLPPASCVELHAATGWHAVSRRDWPVVQRNLDSLLEQMARPGVPFNAFAMHLLFIGTALAAFTDRLDRVMSALEGYVRSSSDLNRSCCHMLRAACRLFRGDTDGARSAADAALATVDRSELPHTVRIYAIVIRALTAYVDADWAGVDSIANELTQADDDALLIRNWRSIIPYFVGRARWLAGDVEGLAGCLRQIPVVCPEESPYSYIHRLLLRGMHSLAMRSYAQAEDAFREASRMEEEHRLTAGHSSATVLLAYTQLRRGRMEESIEMMDPQLELLERLNGPGNLLRENPIIVPLLRLVYEKKRRRGFIERIFERLGVPVHAAGAAGREPLSAREIEVLRVMAEGISNRQIGERLYVSEATVKTHVQRVLRKLDAASRTQAVARAREWMLV